MHLRTISAALAIFLATFAQILLTLPAAAATLLRDPDIEHALQKLASPVLQAVGVSGATRVLVVEDSSLNAFVIDRDTIYLNSGMIGQTETAAQLQFVIAHEAAHIALDHLTRRELGAEHASRIAGIGTALALAGAIGGIGDASVGLGLGVASSAQRGFLAHSRAEEGSADQTAIRAMAVAGLGTQGALDLMGYFSGQEMLGPAQQDPYSRSHPLSRDRLRRMEGLANSYGLQPTRDVSADAYWFARARGKLQAFLQAPSRTGRHAGDSGFEDVRLMQLAVARHQNADWRSAVALMDKALALRGNADPYYEELKGQILLEGRQFAAAQAAYDRAAAGAPEEPLILAAFGHALLVQGGDARLKRAITVLEKARLADPRNPRALRDLGAAYALTGQPGRAALSAAEGYVLSGRMHDAGLQAQRAADLLPRGTPAWQRAQDMLFVSRQDSPR